MKLKSSCTAALASVALYTTLSVEPAEAQIRVGGFTDVFFYASDDSTRESRTGFDIGQFILHLNSNLSARSSVFAELTFSPRGDGWATEVERVSVKFEYSDALKPSAGKYHTPISWWNVAFHHGLWLQTSFDRPAAIRFGSRFVPVHLLGAMVEGSIFPSAWSVDYGAGLGNGRANNIAEAGDGGDADNSRAWVAHAGLRHDAFYDLQVGGAVYGDRFGNTTGNRTQEYIASAFIVLARETPELISEYFYVNHEDRATNVTNTHHSYYVQLAYRLPFADQAFKPYGRAESIDVEESDPAFVGLESDQRRYLAGLRIDFPATVALKLEGQRLREGNREYYNQFFGALSMAF